MMIVVGVQENQMHYMMDGCDPTTAVQMLTACAQAITERIAEGTAPEAPAAKPQAPRPRMYLPNGHNPIPPPIPPKR